MENWTDEEVETLANLARALGHPARVQILRELMIQGECIGGDIADVLPLAASTVSQHLKVLKNAGWIAGRTDGPRRCYCVEASSVAAFRKLVGDIDLAPSQRTASTRNRS